MEEFGAFNETKAEKAGKEFDAQKCEASFKQKDKNKDEVLTKEELAPPMKEKKSKDDSENGDGE
jgi:hypothetical protein